MSLRLFSLLALLACAAAAVTEDLSLHQDVAVADRQSRAVRAYDQSFKIGKIVAYDRQLVSRTVYKSSTWLTVNTETITISTNVLISCIEVSDLLRNGKNAAVTVQKGGAGQTSVTLKFKSQRGEKINYVVTVWGH